jgi:hypothetical protein
MFNLEVAEDTAESLDETLRDLVNYSLLVLEKRIALRAHLAGVTNLVKRSTDPVTPESVKEQVLRDSNPAGVPGFTITSPFTPFQNASVSLPGDGASAIDPVLLPKAEHHYMVGDGSAATPAYVNQDQFSGRPGVAAGLADAAIAAHPAQETTRGPVPDIA